MKILVADDNEDSRVYMEQALSARGHEVVVAVDGLKALAAAREAPPDMIISDILMPIMDGFEFCRRVKEDASLRHTPFIFYTATYTDARDKDLALTLGAARFVTKPMDFLEFQKIIDEVAEEAKDRDPSLIIETLSDGQELNALQLMAVARKLDKKVRELGEEREALEEIQRKLRARNRTLRTLSNANEALVRAESEQDLLDAICQTVVDIGGYQLAWVGYAEQDEKKSVRPVAQYGFEAGYLDSLDIKWDDSRRGQGPTGTAIRTREACVAQAIDTDPRFEPWREEALKRGYASSAALPLIAEEQTLGSINIYSSDQGAFDNEEMILLEELADDLAFGIAAFRVRERQEKAEAELRLAASVFANAADAIVITDPEGSILRVNRAFTEITGYTVKDAIGENPRFLKSGKHDRAFFKTFWKTLLDTGLWQGEIWNRRKDGGIFQAWETVSSVRDSDGKATSYIGMFTDITERRMSEERIRHLAHYDVLTDLPNRLLFIERCEHALHNAIRGKHTIALLFLDIDQFKNINDLLGHPVGDRLLQVVAERLQAALRADDTVARLGGDEFTILVEKLSNAERAATVARNLLDALHEKIVIDGKDLHVTASIGISVYPEDGEDVTTLLKNADAAMYLAKGKGRNNYQYYTQELTTAILERIELENELRRAIDHGQFILDYQPKIDLATNRVTGAEALVRWVHPEKGIVAPNTFIPLAEESGMIVAIGDWVIATACRQMQQWVNSGKALQNISVNVSGRQLEFENFVDKVAMILAETGVDPKILELEVTETTIMKHAERAKSILAALREMGVTITVDDFGTGYSSLGYLKQLPINNLKIDRVFVRDICVDPNDEAIVRAIIALGRTLQMRTIAEGVETEEQMDLLQDFGCDDAQGFFFSKPLSAKKFETFLETQAAKELQEP